MAWRQRQQPGDHYHSPTVDAKELLTKSQKSKKKVRYQNAYTHTFSHTEACISAYSAKGKLGISQMLILSS